MRSDFYIIEHEFPKEDINIFPLSDLHIGAQEFAEGEWDKFKKQILSAPNNYIVIAGDLMNNATRNSVTNVFEETMRPRSQKKWLAEQLEPLKDRILCAVGGNHEARSGKDADDDPLFDVLCKLDIEDRYRQNAAIMVLRFGKRASNHDNHTYTMLVTHGAGGGMTGSGVNRNERFGYVFDGLDILCTGHTHKPVISAPSKIVIDLQNKKVSQKPFLCVTATAWMNYGGYAMRKQLTPASIRPQVIHLSGKKKEMHVTM
jgi:predicted phosphodiesterase